MNVLPRFMFQSRLTFSKGDNRKPPDISYYRAMNRILNSRRVICCSFEISIRSKEPAIFNRMR